MHEKAPSPSPSIATNKRAFAKFAAPSFITRGKRLCTATPGGRGGEGSQPTNNRAKSNSALPKIFFWWWGTGERGDAAVFRQKIEEEDRILNPHQKSESSGGTIDTISDFARYSVSPTHYRTNASHDAPASSSEAAAPISLSLPFAVECEMRIFYVMKEACALCARCKADDFCWRIEW